MSGSNVSGVTIPRSFTDALEATKQASGPVERWNANQRLAAEYRALTPEQKEAVATKHQISPWSLMLMGNEGAQHIIRSIGR